MRRLPVYLVLDVSGSMSGEPIEAVRDGVQKLVAFLRQDPYALETAYLSVITFDGEARQVTPLTELVSFQAPAVKAGTTTSLGAALSLTADCIEREVKKTSADHKGDWKPLVFLMTDGGPTDDWRSGLGRFKQVKAGLVVACAVDNADLSVLREITENIVTLSTADQASISAFFKWVSASVSASSKRIDLTKKDSGSLDELPPPPPEIRIV